MKTAHLEEAFYTNDRSVLDKLTPTQYLVLQAKYVYRLTNEDIARVLGKNESTVRSYTSGRAKLDRGNAGLLHYTLTGTLPKYFRHIVK